jgi:hypothetical protein
MRFHPFFNTISLKSTKKILTYCQLTQLMSGTLLYNEGDESDKVYLILSGVIVLHNKEKGAIAVLTMKNTCGEEALFGDSLGKLESAYAQSQSCLLQFDCE